MNDFNPYAPPKASLDGMDIRLWRVGKIIIMPKESDFPDRCVKCAEPTTWRLERKLSWHPSGWYLLLLLNILLYVIVAMCIRKNAKISVPLCERHRRKRRNAILGAWGLVLLAFMTMFSAAAINSASPIPPEAVIIVGVVILVGAIILGMVGSQTLTPERIDDENVWLKGAGHEFLDELPTSPV
jgi:hypothetical protein